MAEVTLNPLDPGDVLDASSINDLMDGIKLAVNDVEADALSPGALNANHLPSLMRESKQVVIGGIAPATHSYTGMAYPAFVAISQGGTPLDVTLGSSYAFSADFGGALVCATLSVESLGASTFFRVESWDGAAWVSITRSERVAGEGSTHVSIRTLLTVADHAIVSQVRVVVSQAFAADTVVLRDCSLSVLILHGPRE